MGKRLLILAGLAGAGFGLRRLVRQAEGTDATVPEPEAPAPRKPAAAYRKPAEGPTRDELYAEAKSLGIKGRSGMSKQQLTEAVRAAKAEPVEGAPPARRFDRQGSARGNGRPASAARSAGGAV
jgi:hypothetical protein